MKKFLMTTFCISIIAIGPQGVVAEAKTQTPPQPPKISRQTPPPNLDVVLQLTDKQKEQARLNRIEGRKQLKPVMDEINAKKEAIMDVIDSTMPETQKQEKINALHKDLKVLREKANIIRQENMEAFEKILTKEQKKKLEKIKKELNPTGCKQCALKMPPPPPPMDED